MARDFYAVLGVGRGATTPEIRGRFRELAKAHHPDRFRGVEKLRAQRDFQEIAEAFNVLIDPERRRRHDMELIEGRQASDRSRKVQLWLGRGAAALKERRLAEAVECFTRATEEDPRSADAWQHLAVALSSTERGLPEAVVAAAHACEIRQYDAPLLKLAGRLHAAVGRVSEARRYYNEALQWGGEDSDIVKALEILAKGGKAGNPGGSASSTAGHAKGSR
jgi:curved DNA-binding protein CbpA